MYNGFLCRLYDTFSAISLKRGQIFKSAWKEKNKTKEPLLKLLSLLSKK